MACCDAVVIPLQSVNCPMHVHQSVIRACSTVIENLMMYNGGKRFSRSFAHRFFFCTDLTKPSMSVSPRLLFLVFETDALPSLSLDCDEITARQLIFWMYTRQLPHTREIINTSRFPNSVVPIDSRQQTFNLIHIAAYLLIEPLLQQVSWRRLRSLLACRCSRCC